MGRIMDGIKLFGGGVFLFLGGYFWLLPQSYQADFLARAGFYVRRLNERDYLKTPKSASDVFYECR